MASSVDLDSTRLTRLDSIVGRQRHAWHAMCIRMARGHKNKYTNELIDRQADRQTGRSRRITDHWPAVSLHALWLPATPSPPFSPSLTRSFTLAVTARLDEHFSLSAPLCRSWMDGWMNGGFQGIHPSIHPRSPPFSPSRPLPSLALSLYSNYRSYSCLSVCLSVCPAGWLHQSWKNTHLTSTSLALHCTTRERGTHTQASRRADTQAGREAGREKGRQPDTHTHTHTTTQLQLRPP